MPCIGCDPNSPDPTDPTAGVSCTTIGAQYVQANSGSQYVHSGDSWNVTAADNSGSAVALTYTLSGVTSGSGSTTLDGVAFNLGTTTVRWTATDAAGNSDYCEFTVTVDNTVPCIGCDPTSPDPTDPTAGVSCTTIGSQYVQPNSGDTYVHSGTGWNVTAADNSGSAVTLTYAVSGATTTVTGDNTTLDGQEFNMGVTTVTWTATDAAGNSVPCSFTVTVKGSSDQVSIICPDASSVTKTYDGTPLAPVATATSLINSSDVFTIEYNTTSDPTDETAWSTTVPSITNAGSQHVYVRAINPNYESATCEYTLTVNKKTLNITGTLEKVYDGTPFEVNFDNPGLTYDGLVSGDAFTMGKITTDGYKVGEYHCTNGQFLRFMEELVANNGSYGPAEVTANYTPVFNVTLKITKRPIELIANSGEKVYDGTPIVVSGYTLSGTLGENDVLSADVVGERTCVGTEVSEVVATSVQIMHNGENVNDCYDITLTPGELKVTKLTDGLSCVGTKTFTLTEGTSSIEVTADMIGAATYTGTAVNVQITNNLAGMNPMTVRDDPYEVVWVLRDQCGQAMAYCTTYVTVQYTPCEGTYTMANGSYPYKRIGSQCWFTVNLREEVGDYHAYKDNDDNLGKFGYLYSWYTAVGVTPEGNNSAAPATQIGDNGEPYVQGICPAGWSIGSEEDYTILNNYVGNVILLKDPSTQYWQSGYEGVTPNSGFNARGGGWYNSSLSRYEDLMTGYRFWTSDGAAGSTTATGGVINYYCDSTMFETSQKADRRSVRCIRKVAP